MLGIPNLSFSEDQISHADWYGLDPLIVDRSRFSLRPASDVSGAKFSILRVGKTTYGSRIASMPKARLYGDSLVGVFGVVHRAHRTIGSSST
ncbi:hypothetical protein B296_00019285 [Ensete ventricosum]|uniref:Uncharacterized protein n=1 Tax=Ensete ventricosum TaxID=4639 RepID=A0A426ZN09_ENSVE|nr:hypothetical protein B296_00019285 [Ensete ventricosum]